MLERIDKLVFYFTIECANCKNTMKVSHTSVEERNGDMFCSLCGKTVKVPNHQDLVSSAKTLNAYLGDTLNAKYINLVMNEQYEKADGTPPAH
jgi:transcription elongation factor Elf1